MASCRDLASRTRSCSGCTAWSSGDGGMITASRGDLPWSRFIHDQMRAFRHRGGAVLVVSEDLDELMGLCDRILVMASGRITGQFPRAAFDAYQIGALMSGRGAG